MTDNTISDREFYAGCFCKQCGVRLAYNDRETFCPDLNCSADKDLKGGSLTGICDHCNTEPCECKQETLGEQRRTSKKKKKGTHAGAWFAGQSFNGGTR